MRSVRRTSSAGTARTPSSRSPSTLATTTSIASLDAESAASITIAGTSPVTSVTMPAHRRKQGHARARGLRGPVRPAPVPGPASEPHDPANCPAFRRDQAAAQPGRAMCESGLAVAVRCHVRSRVVRSFPRRAGDEGRVAFPAGTAAQYAEAAEERQRGRSGCAPTLNSATNLIR